jgi:hypothetical protein
MVQALALTGETMPDYIPSRVIPRCGLVNFPTTVDATTVAVATLPRPRMQYYLVASSAIRILASPLIENCRYRLGQRAAPSFSLRTYVVVTYE